MTKTPFTLTVGTETTIFSRKDRAVAAGEATGESFTVTNPNGKIVHTHIVEESLAPVAEDPQPDPLVAGIVRKLYGSDDEPEPAQTTNRPATEAASVAAFNQTTNPPKKEYNDMETIRDLRERKSLSQKAVRTACGLSYSTYVRIEEGSGRTTPEEVERVLAVLREMPDGTRKLGGGRPFKDPAKREAVAKARQNGESVAAALARANSSPAPTEAGSETESPVSEESLL